MKIIGLIETVTLNVKNNMITTLVDICLTSCALINWCLYYYNFIVDENNQEAI